MHEMKKRYIVQVLALLLLLTGCRNPTATGWKTVVDENGNVTLMDPMMQDFLASKEPKPTQESLDAMLSQATRIRVMSAGMSGDELLVLSTNESAQAEVLLDTSDKQQVAAFRDLLEIVEDTDTFGHCMCVGWPTLEFYAEGRLISRIGMHHGCSIRWAKWKWDAHLKNNVALLDWLAANGAPQPKKAYETDLAYIADQERKYQRWLDAVPTCLRSRWDEIQWGSPSEPTRETIGDLTALLAKAISEEQKRVLVLLEWQGHGEGPWNGVPIHEYSPAYILVQIGMPGILKALDGATLTEAQTEGVARFFCFSGPFVYSERGGRNGEYRDVLDAPKELRDRIREHVLSQKDKDKKDWMENSLLFKGGIEPTVRGDGKPAPQP
jgi:hypothetical protein